MSYTRSRVALLLGSSLPMILALTVAPIPQKPAGNGAALFAQTCAPCHGAKGAGGAGYRKALTGSKTVSELGKYIAQSMPPGPKKTPLAKAQAIAEYMHGAFYSPLAQEKIRPARVTMQRLTVRQFRNSLADLIGDYRPAVPSAPGGLKASYFKGRDRSQKNRLIDRVDPEVKFDFGTAAPGEGDFDLHNFTITWNGSLYAPDTGDYELIIQTDRSARLSFNGARKPLIDAWVKSGKDTEFKETVTLLGGRSYPITLEFAKASQGVNDDEKKKKLPPGPAFVKLLWRRPKSSPEVIPPNYLFPSGSAPTYIADSPFPADDRSIGYERGNTVSKEWDDATTAAALEAANTIAGNISGLTRVPDNAPDRLEKLKAFARGFVARAFRRPLTKEVEQLYVDKQFESAASPEIAIKRVVILTIKSPQFLYREIGSRSDPYAVASDLSFGLWDSVPDAELQRAAAGGELATAAGIQRQATRMANDPRAWTKLRDFLMLWLKVDEIPEIVKSQQRFPGFDKAVATDLRTSFELFLDNTAWGKDADYRQLMLSTNHYLNGRLSKLYGGSLPGDAPFQAVSLPERPGVLTHPYLLSRFAYLEGSSPIHRGVLVARSMLGRVLAPPPQAFAPLAASLHPDMTTRQRVELQTKPPMCNGCHSLINPLGFTFEKYDAIGRVRSEDNGKPVDASGSYSPTSGPSVTFKDIGELTTYIADSDEAHAAFVEKLFQHLTKQPVRAYGPKVLNDLLETFRRDRYNIRSLMVSIMMATAPQSLSKP